MKKYIDRIKTRVYSNGSSQKRNYKKRKEKEY
nr:MAG TPA: hypothetical protein [Herelleviridae sp.]